MNGAAATIIKMHKIIINIPREPASLRAGFSPFPAATVSLARRRAYLMRHVKTRY